jgi:5'-nucleotidase
MRYLRFVAFGMALLVVSSGCTLLQDANRWAASPGTLAEPFWCDPSGGTTLNAADCQTLSAQLDAASLFAYEHDHASEAIAAGATSTSYVTGVGAPFQFTAPTSTFDYRSPDTLLYDGTLPTSQVAGLEWNVDSGASAPAGFAGPNDVWTNEGGGFWQLRVWILRPFQNEPNVFASTHPCLAAGGPVYSLTDSCYTSTHTYPLQILVSNDDGYNAPGIDAAVNALYLLPGGVHVTVSAPDSNQSGTGGSTSPDPLSAVLSTTLSGKPAWAVHGFPADSVRYALKTLHVNPDLLVSGINNGQNVTLPIIAISGTVGAARAGGRASIPAVALSQALGTPDDFPSGVIAMTDWIDRFLFGRAGPPLFQSVVNVDIPTCTSGSIRGTLVLPAATSSTGAFGAQNCSSTATGFTNDLQAFVNGYVTETSIGNG